uniref:Uncharacterized protein n=1 Tax=Cacopsylla melanoneura TaxID=428564 RepID=A0A8D8R7Y5_9HEMI
MKPVGIAIFCIVLSVAITLGSGSETEKPPEGKTCCQQLSKCPFKSFFTKVGRVFTLHFWKRHYHKIVHGKDIGVCDPANCKCVSEDDRHACLKANHTCPCSGQKSESKTS